MFLACGTYIAIRFFNPKTLPPRGVINISTVNNLRQKITET